MKRLRYQSLPRTVTGTTEDILSFLDEHGTHDKDYDADVSEQSRLCRSARRRSGALRMTLDLHGLTSAEAAVRVRGAIGSCRSRGMKELLIIHGKGRHRAPSQAPVLKTLIREMLDKELSLSVLRFRTGLPREGGEGVTVAYMV